ncbi:MAG: NTP transferase domain-containing protein [Gammaproteobacteria bacterium]|nr:NTP transferase domain-containing protein [Gammaproteobacteria bacterium]
MTVPESLNGLVLAGGKSRRMGSDKAALRAGGETQLARAVNLLLRHVGDVFVSTAADQTDDPLRQNFRQIVDRYEDMGPVAGIMSALDTSPQHSWLVLACDLPNIDDGTIEFLIRNASAEKPFTAYRSVNDGLPEPLCAIYRPESRSHIDRFVAEGIVCPRKMLINSPTTLLEQPNPGALHNINTPADLDGTDVDLAS